MLVLDQLIISYIIIALFLINMYVYYYCSFQISNIEIYNFANLIS